MPLRADVREDEPRLAEPRFAGAFAAGFVAFARLVVALDLRAVERRAAERGVVERRPYSPRPSGCSLSIFSGDFSFDWLVFLALGISFLLATCRRDGASLRAAARRTPESRDVGRVDEHGRDRCPGQVQ
jgi:hypothetical protein